MIISEIPLKEILRYYEPHRFYHNFDHISSMIKLAIENDMLSDDLFLAIIFHDIIYDPKRTDNEEKSAELFYSYFNSDEIKKAILETKNHKPTTELSRYLSFLDLAVLYGDFETFVDYDNKIFKEFKFMEFNEYKKNRLKVLKELNVDEEFLEYVKNKTLEDYEKQ